MYSIFHPTLEPLEDRTLLSFSDPFLTFVIHGQDWDNDTIAPQWATDLGEAIANKYQPTVYDEVNVFGWATRNSNTLPGEAQRLADEIAGRAGVLFDQAEQKPVDLHLIGFSRGAVLVSEAIKILEVNSGFGDLIDRFLITTLDPHPDSFYYDDPEDFATGAAFIDNWQNYYQTTSEPFADGQPINGADNFDITELVEAWDGEPWNGDYSNHSEVHDWFHWVVEPDFASYGTGPEDLRPTEPPLTPVDPSTVLFVEELDPGTVVEDPPDEDQPSETELFVQAAYIDILGRLPEQGGLEHWTARIESGLSHSEFAGIIWNSTEHRGLQLNHVYTRYMARGVDDAGRTFWISALQNGLSEHELILALITSPEFAARHGADDSPTGNRLIVEALYSDLLGRVGDDGGIDHWTTALNNGLARSDLARIFIDVEERRIKFIDCYFAEFLDRQANEDEMSAALASWDSGLPVLDFAAQLVAMEEYYDLAKIRQPVDGGICL